MPVDITETYIRIRVRNPDLFVDDSFKTIWLSQPQGIKAIIGKLKSNPNGSTAVQNYMFIKTKWTTAQAESWVAEHEKDISWVFGENEEINLSTGESKTMESVKKNYEVELKKFDDENRSFEAVASTEAIDRDGDIIRSRGWKLSNFKKNPVVLWAHASDVPPIAKAENITIEDNRLVFTPKFIPKEIHPFADQIYQMYKQGYLKSFSVRFDPIKWEDISVDGDEKGLRIKRGREYKEQELLEISAVSIPANPEAIARKDFQNFVIKSYIVDNIGLIKDNNLRDRLLKDEIEDDEKVILMKQEIEELKKRIELFEGIDLEIENLKNETEAKTLIKKCQEGINLLDKIGSR
jgi:HK97 family phage prohead protease